MHQLRHHLLAVLVASAAPACAIDDVGDSTSTVRSAIEEREPAVGHGLPPVRGGTYPAGTSTPQHGGGITSGNWKPVTTTPSMGAGFSILLTDGSVMVQDLTYGGGEWWKLTPDSAGSYATGTWTQLPSMPNGYAPLYFASAVLPDGRVVFMGGEYEMFEPTWGNHGAIYDPVANSWTSLSAPAGWTTIGDAQSVVLADGRYVLSNCCTTEMAVLDPVTLTWSPINSAGKADVFDEEGWTLLPNGTLLTVDSNNLESPTNSEIWTAPDAHHAGGWASGGPTNVEITDVSSWEVGPAMIRPDGTVFQSGATGHTAIYDLRQKKWRAGPDFPVIPGEGQLDQADGPAALLPNGNVLLAASPGLFQQPVHYVEFDGTSLTEVASPAAAIFDSSYHTNLLLLPTGEVMATDFSNDIELYTQAASTGGCHNTGSPPPQVTSMPSTLTRGRTYSFSGEQLHGISSGVSYGDDAQASTNYPIVQITNRATGHVQYGRTRGFSNFSIARGARSSALLDVPATLEPGTSDLVVIVNGIPSDSMRVKIK